MAHVSEQYKRTILRVALQVESFNLLLIAFLFLALCVSGAPLVRHRQGCSIGSNVR